MHALTPYVDVWLAETLSAVEEARLVRDVLGDDARPLWLSFTIEDEAVEGCKLRSGESVETAVETAVSLRAAAVLFNCSQPEAMAQAVSIAVATVARLKSGMRVGVYANAFPPHSKTATANASVLDIRQDLTPEGYLIYVREWVKRGATMVGGCCGIGAEHIAAMKAAVL